MELLPQKEELEDEISPNLQYLLKQLSICIIYAALETLFFFLVDILILMHILIKAIVFTFPKLPPSLRFFFLKRRKKVKAQLETIPTNSRV